MIVATGNAKKLAELKTLLGERLGTVSGDPPGLEVEEDAPSFAGNACKKLFALRALLRERGDGHKDFLLADDSGLEVKALGNRPGVRSARLGADEARRTHSAQPSDQDEGCRAALLALMQKVPDDKRQARLCCALALLPPGSDEPLVFEGVLDGSIVRSARGSAGFGYDPLFVPVGEEQTLAELGAAYKNRISHRRRAIAALIEATMPSDSDAAASLA